MDTSFQIFLFLIGGFFVIGSLAWHFSRSREVLEHWAEEHGFELLHTEHRNLVRGPFFWTTSRCQTVYYVRVRDQQGVERSGWVRCGGWFLGLMTNTAEVRWEDELRTQLSGYHDLLGQAISPQATSGRSANIESSTNFE